MGSSLFAEMASFVYWRAAVEKQPVPDPFHIMALTMAHHALDHDTKKHPGRIYFGGWAVLAYAMNYTEWPNAGAHRQVARGITYLSDIGAIRLALTQTRPHRRYEILPPNVTPRNVT